jgi:hypothetical protein
MHIDKYRFGHVDIKGHGYDADVIIFPDHVQQIWWCREGQRLSQEDLETVLAEKPEVLVVGTGYYGRVQVPVEMIDALRGADVDVRIARTGEAEPPSPASSPSSMASRDRTIAANRVHSS